MSKIICILDAALAPFTFLSSVWLRAVRRIGLGRMKISRTIFLKEGILPVINHYHEPLFDPKQLRHALRKDRTLPGIDLNIKEQLEILNRFSFNDELAKFPVKKTDKLEFYYNNESFGAADAQYFYNIVRLYRPKKIIEIGSGNSTLMARNAIKMNKRDDMTYDCRHICIEPYEAPWLEDLDIMVLRKRAEQVDKGLFVGLNTNDILFIDSSHVIKPQGDVLFEVLEILPMLKTGVLVHVHDIFTPKDYLNEWVLDELKLWNEQYLMEAFLTFNDRFKIIASLNYLTHNYFSEISRVCPILKSEPHKEPCSFWIVKK